MVFEVHRTTYDLRSEGKILHHNVHWMISCLMQTQQHIRLQRQDMKIDSN